MHDGHRPSAGIPMAGALPFRAGQTRYHILRAKPGSPVQLFCANPTLYGVRTHYVEGRTQPCVDDTRGYCDHCQESKPRWYGYIAGLVPLVGRIALAELTFEAASNCPTLREIGTSLRGLHLKIERIGTNKRGRCVATFEPMRVRVNLPPPVDIPAALCAVWGVTPVVAGFQVEPQAQGGDA